MPKHCKSELKALIRKLSVMACAEATTSARPDATKRVPHSSSGVEGVQMLRKQADSTIEHMARQDLRVFSRRADVYRERRRLAGVLRQARESSRVGSPSPSCLRRATSQQDSHTTSDTIRAEKGSATDSAARSVRIVVDDVTTSITPGGACGGFAQAHWTDEFHEPDGTHPRLIVDADRRDGLRERELLLDKDSVSEVEARRAVTEGWFFQRGENVGAALLSRHLLALHNRDGRVSCVDDVSGETLSEEGVRAARALEMK